MLGTNIGGYITTKFGLKRTLFGVGVGNLVDTDGSAIDRLAHRPLHLSGKLQVGYRLTMASGQSCVVNGSVRDSDAASGTYADLATGSATVTANDDGSAVEGVLEVDVNLIGAKQYLKTRASATLTASGSSVGEVFALLTVGGGETIPPTETAQ